MTFGVYPTVFTAFKKISDDMALSKKMFRYNIYSRKTRAINPDLKFVVLRSIKGQVFANRNLLGSEEMEPLNPDETIWTVVSVQPIAVSSGSVSVSISSTMVNTPPPVTSCSLVPVCEDVATRREATVDEAVPHEAALIEASVVEATVDEAAPREASVVEATRDEAAPREASVVETTHDEAANREASVIEAVRSADIPQVPIKCAIEKVTMPETSLNISTSDGNEITLTAKTVRFKVDTKFVPSGDVVVTDTEMYFVQSNHRMSYDLTAPAVYKWKIQVSKDTPVLVEETKADGTKGSLEITVQGETVYSVKLTYDMTSFLTVSSNRVQTYPRQFSDIPHPKRAKY